MIIEQKTALPTIAFPKVLANYVRISRAPVEFYEIIRHPAAPELFSMVRESAVRTERELAGIAQAVREGKFDSTAHDITRRQVRQQIAGDPLFRLADTYWRENTDQGIPLIAESNEEKEGESEASGGEVVIFDRLHYQGSKARMIRLLAGTSQDHPLKRENLAPLIYPTELDESEAIKKTKRILESIPEQIKARHPQYQFLRIQDSSNRRRSGYLIAPITQDEKRLYAEEELTKPQVDIVVHSDNEYLQIGNRIIQIDSGQGVSLAASDAMRLLNYLVERQGEKVSSLEVLNAVYNSMNLTVKQRRGRNTNAKKWLKNVATFNGNPIVSIEGAGIGAHYEVKNFDINFQLTDVPFSALPIDEDSNVVILDDREGKARRKREKLSSQHQNGRGARNYHELKESQQSKIAIVYYDEQGIVQVGNEIISLRWNNGSKSSRPGIEALRVLEMLIDSPEEGLSAKEIRAGLYGQEYIDDPRSCDQKFSQTTKWIKEKLNYKGIPLIHHSGRTSDSRYKLNNVRVAYETSNETLGVLREDLVVLPDGNILTGKQAAFVKKLSEHPLGVKISYDELFQYLFTSQEILNMSNLNKLNRLTYLISNYGPVLETYFGIHLERKRMGGVSYVSSEVYTPQSDNQPFTYDEMLAIVSDLFERNTFVFPDGVTIPRKPAIATYLLLKASPKYVSMRDLQMILYGRIDEETTAQFDNVRYRVRKTIEGHIPGTEVVRVYDNGKMNIAVQGLPSDFNPDTALSSVPREITVHTSVLNSAESDGERVIVFTTEDENIIESYLKASALIADIKSGRKVFWDDYLPEEKHALLTVIAYDLGKPMSMLTDDDLQEEKYQLLGGCTLRSYYTHESKRKTKEDKGSNTLFILESLGVTTTVDDIIEQVKNDRQIPTGRITWGLVQDVLKIASSESGVPIEMMGHLQLKRAYTFLGRRDLMRFYELSRNDPERGINETPIHYLRKQLGFSEIPLGVRSRYRYSEMSKMYQKLDIKLGQLEMSEELLHWTESIAFLYQSYFYDFEKEEVQNEAFIGVASALRDRVTDPKQLILRVYTHLEHEFSQRVVRRYEEESILKPVGRDDNGGKVPTRIDNIIYETRSSSTIETLPSNWQPRIQQLLPEAQFLIYATAVEAWTFDIIIEEFYKRFNREIDIDELQEVYQSALASLQESLELEN